MRVSKHSTDNRRLRIEVSSAGSPGVRSGVADNHTVAGRTENKRKILAAVQRGAARLRKEALRGGDRIDRADAAGFGGEAVRQTVPELNSSVNDYEVLRQDVKY